LQLLLKGGEEGLMQDNIAVEGHGERTHPWTAAHAAANVLLVPQTHSMRYALTLLLL
jgi:hypothetical protein